MSFITETINEMDAGAVANLGNVSDTIKEAGTHLATIKKAYETVASNYKALTIEFESANGTARVMEFAGIPQSDSQEDIDKANAKTKRVVDILARVAKAVGMKDIKQAITGAASSTNEKGNDVTEFPKLAGKQLYITTFTEIEGDKKDASKTYVKQAVDTYKFLDKNGKDGMDRDRLDAFDAEAKDRIEISYQFRENPSCIQKLAQVKEQRLGSVASTTPTQNLSGMPSAQQPAASTTPDLDI